MTLFVYPPTLITGIATEATLLAVKSDTAALVAKDFATSAKQDTTNTKLDTLHTDLGSLSRLSGSLVPAAYDYIAYTSGVTTDVYVYKTGGAGGATVKTVTVSYPDATKAVFSTVAAT